MLSKLFEKIYVKNLDTVMDESGIILEYKFGFRSTYGTILRVHDEVYHSGLLDYKLYPRHFLVKQNREHFDISYLIRRP